MARRLDGVRSVTPRLRRAPALAAAALVVVGVTDVLLMNAVARAHDKDAAQQHAMDAARTLVPVLLSYDYQSLDADLERSRSSTTGDFRNDFDKLISSVVRPAATNRHVATTAVVSGAGVVSSTPGKVTVLVLVTQTSTSTIHKSPVVTGSRVKVQMAWTGDRWLIAGLDPV